MVFNDLFQYVPHFRFDTLDKALRTLDVVGKVLLNKLTHDEWLEEFQCHTFWQTTLVQFQVWSNHDYRTTRVVNTLTKQVLTEAALLTFEHVGQALELMIAR